MYNHKQMRLKITIINSYTVHTAGAMKTVPSVYTLLMKTICLSHSTQVAERTVFRETHGIFFAFSKQSNKIYVIWI